MTTVDPSDGVSGQERPPRDFNAAYAGTPPWDIGRPQPAFLNLAHAGLVTGRVLDVGCGTGEHALMAASLGLSATGVDSAPAAIELARAKAAGRGLDVRFLVHDAMELDTLGERFDTAIDCGLFHVFSDADRLRYAASLHAVISPGGRYHMLGFSDLVPGDFGPRRLTRDEIVDTFSQGWHVDSLERVPLETTEVPPGIPAWLATITRT